MKIGFLTLLFSLISQNSFAKGGDDAGNGGTDYLKRSFINQYTCLLFNGVGIPNGSTETISFAKSYSYYLDNELPDPISPDNHSKVCHDFQMYGDVDDALFPRLELIPNAFSLFSRFDQRLNQNASGKKEIDSLIENKMREEYSIPFNSNLFSRMNLDTFNFGYLLKPLYDTETNLFQCPTKEKENINPLEKVITSFTGDTEGLYYGVKETEVLKTGTGQTQFNSSLFVTESTLMNFGFYLRNGTKNKISDTSSLENKTIFLYYPFNETIDPLIKGNRKLITIKLPSPESQSKKLGCIFKNKENK